jgi:hypothetical protein
MVTDWDEILLINGEDGCGIRNRHNGSFYIHEVFEEALVFFVLIVIFVEGLEKRPDVLGAFGVPS